jgi:hypothetical protein
MANGYTRVRPGDLITSTGFNDLLTALEDLEARVAAIENGTVSGGDLAITGLHPAVGPYRVGDTLTIFGRNFEFSTGAGRVFLDGVRVLTFQSSTDTQLVFTIPPVPGVAEPGAPVTLRVTNSSEEATQQIVLRPAPVVLFGDVDVTWNGVSPATIVPDQPATFQFHITSRASAAADFLIDPLIGVATAQSVWQSRLQVLDGALNPLAGRVVHLAPNQQQTIHVRISTVPSGTSGVSFTLTVSASSGGVTGTSGTLPFQVGTAVTPPDPTIQLSPTALIGPGSLVGDTVTLSGGQTTRVRFLTTFEQPGTYDLTVTPAGSGWTVQRFATTPAQYVIVAGDIGTSGHAQRFPEISIQTNANPASAGTAQVRYQRQGNSNNRTFILNLSRGV